MADMYSREVTEAHFLHERQGLEPVLRPPVKSPSALCWLSGTQELVAASREGRLHHIDPVHGTRTIAEEVGEVASMVAHPATGEFLLVSRDGLWRVVTPTGHTRHVGTHRFLSAIDTLWVQNYAVMVGDEVDGRFLVITQDGQVKSRVRLPARVAVALDKDGSRLVLVRSMPEGLAVVPFGKDAKLPKGEATVHRVQPSNGVYLGFTSTGICAWHRPGEPPLSMRLPDLSAGAVSADGTWLGLGTRGGAVALARMDQASMRVHPDLVRAFQSPVTCVAFADSGRWLATGAESLRIWSWEG